MKLFSKSSELQLLAQANSKTNYDRNKILTFAIALAIIVLFSSFSLARGKVTIDAIKYLREKGSASSAYLTNANEEQYVELEKLNYIETVGVNKIFGKWYQKDIFLATCEIVDEAGYEKIIKPAYDGIVGKYPEAPNEVMMPRKLLETLGINDYELGMKISVPITFRDWSINGGYELTEKLILSGYYNDYVDKAKNKPIVYFSEQYLSSKEIAIYPTNLLIKFKSNFLNDLQIEKQLYRDVELANERQQFVGIGSADVQVIKQFVGGYGMAILCASVVLLSVYLLIYNVLSISLNKDIRYYGMLFAIGITQKQIKRLIFKESESIVVKGTLVGVIVGIVMGAVGFPLLFQGLFLEHKGKVGIEMIFYPEILIGSVLLVAIIMFAANGQIVKKMKGLTPVEAYKYNSADMFLHKKKTSRKGASIAKMAWYNLFRSKRKFVITIISLFLGCEMALLAVFITNGTDTMNELLQRSDFEVGVQRDAVEGYVFSYSIDGFEPNMSKPLFDEGLMKEIIDIDELDRNSVIETYGYYGYFKTNDEFIQPKEKAAHGTGMSNTGMTIQVVNDQYIHELEAYVKTNQLNTDIDSLKSGGGILLLHKHELSKVLEIEAIETVGKPAYIYSVDEEEYEGNGTKFTCVGYLDMTREGFPPLTMSWNGEGTNYFIISESGAERLSLVRQVFGIKVNAQKGQEATVKEKLVELVNNKNNEHDTVNVYYLSSTSDELLREENYINNSRVVIIALCSSLFLLGVANYLNVLITNIISRKKEFEIMENIGMTRRQLNKMIVMEGIYYWTILVTLLLVVSTLVTSVIGFVIKKNVAYFKFIYPVREFIVMAIILLLFCTVIQQIVYKKSLKKNAVRQC